MNSLAIIIPVFNEEKNISNVLLGWNLKLSNLGIKKYKFIIVNDGSSDNTLNEINKIKKNNFDIYTIKNSGHGNACIFGYNIAIKEQFEWILQIDGDGQCNPNFIDEFNKNTKHENIIYGFRKIRKDGYLRLLFSRILSYLIFCKTFLVFKDANVPYRLIKSGLVKNIINDIPEDVILKNVLLTILLKKKYKRIHYLPITFDERAYGKSKYNILSLLKQVLNLIMKI